MSGKKASDVSALLSKGVDARKAGEVNFQKIILESKNSIIYHELEYNSIIKNISLMECKLSDEAFKEFETESRGIEKQFIKLKTNLKFKTSNIAKIEDEVKNLEDKVIRLDKESENLRNLIKTKSHYCDREYEKANELANEYQRISSMRNQILQRIKGMSSEATLDLCSAKNNLKQIEELMGKITNINDKAKAVISIRKKAIDAKQFIVNEINSIDEKIAKKFMKEEYLDIKIINNDMKNILDEDMLKRFNAMEEKISSFKNTLQEKYAEYEKIRLESEAYFGEVESLIMKDNFYNPMDYAKNRENAKAITLFDFLKDYAKNEYVNEIKEGLVKSKEFIKLENFESAKQKLNEVRDLIEQAINYADIKQEAILKNIFMASDVRNIMRKLNYQADASIIDGDITKGFKVICKAGDEIIDFEKVFVDDKGNVTMDIDHTESVNGTCGITWEKLQTEFTQHGILVQDILKNGKSIINVDKKQDNTQSEKEKIKLN